ncbi:hypothetical protein DF135_36025 [Burkholderia cepacia]|nr:hypothetical protein DF135_36025 [Burkholderia cepacia]
MRGCWCKWLGRYFAGGALALADASSERAGPHRHTSPVGDQLADAVLRATKNGVRFTTGMPPAGCVVHGSTTR